MTVRITVTADLPGYTETEGYAYTETNLYNVGDEKLIWSGRSKTKFSATRYELIQAFVKTMLDGLSEAKPFPR